MGIGAEPVFSVVPAQFPLCKWKQGESEQV
jgi:hypothetical protein